MQDGKVSVGGKRLKLNADEVELAAEGDWRLVECTAYSKDGWKSLKLYLDRPEIKNVWRLGLHNLYRAKTKDGFLLQQFYPAMWDWVVARANGKEAALPPDEAEPAPVSVPMKISNFITDQIEARDPKLRPLSNKPQTLTQGRYLVNMVAQEFSIPELMAKIYINTMIKHGVIEFAMTDKHNRISGLRLVEVANG